MEQETGANSAETAEIRADAATKPRVRYEYLRLLGVAGNEATLPCGCYAKYRQGNTQGTWLITALSFLCPHQHRQGDVLSAWCADTPVMRDVLTERDEYLRQLKAAQNKIGMQKHELTQAEGYADRLREAERERDSWHQAFDRMRVVCRKADDRIQEAHVGYLSEIDAISERYEDRLREAESPDVALLALVEHHAGEGCQHCQHALRNIALRNASRDRKESGGG